MAARLGAAFPQEAPGVLGAGTGLVESTEGFTLAAPRTDPRSVVPRLARRADGGVELRIGTFGVRVREALAEGDGGVTGAVVAYPRSDGASFWGATATGVEEWLHLDAGAVRAGEPAAVWEIEGATALGTGREIMLLDETGAPRIRVTAPSAITASGRALAPRLAATETRIELWVDTGEESALVDPVWEPAGALSTGRSGHTATLLPGGDVLVVGGLDHGASLPSAERFHSASDSWTSVASMALGRSDHTATLLPNGQVLVSGGHLTGFPQVPTPTTERYDPGSDTWASAASLHVDRAYHAATLLPDGRVLVTGGTQGLAGPVLDAAEIYDPAANTWSTTAPMLVHRGLHTATLLPNGKVLVVGGATPATDPSVEIYDPEAGTWSLAASMSTGRVQHQTTLLHDGTVLVTGGWFGGVLASAERYEPVTDTWSPAAPMSTERTWFTATLLDSGGVMVAGGASSSLVAQASVEVYDPFGDAWMAGPSLITARASHSATRLLDGSVLIAGGDDKGSIATAERVRFLALGEFCATSVDCATGFCADGVCCDAACDGGPCDACTAALGADADGVCTLFTGPACDDGDACTQVDTCEAGACVGTSPIVCSASNDCHVGSCDPTTGACLDVAEANGTTCSDTGDCTGPGACQSGSCVVTCPAPDGCHLPSVCDPVTGGCATPPKQPNGVPCDDGDACTQLDECQDGSCVGTIHVVCSSASECQEGTCDPLNGVCGQQAEPDGTTCSVGTCLAGVCTEAPTSDGGAGGGGAGAGGADGSRPRSYAFGGCGCRAAGPGGGEGALAAAALAIGLAARRRRIRDHRSAAMR